MEYSLKKINLKAKKGEKIDFPPLNERVIEMRGQVVELTLAGLQATQEKRAKQVKELIAKRDFEAAKMANIEAHHPFVKELSDQDLHTAWMYFEAKALVSTCGKEAEKIQGYIDIDNTEIKEIVKQIPELSETAQAVMSLINKDA